MASLFYEIDVDRSGSIDIDELTSYILGESSNLSTIAQASILNIKSSRKLTLTDLRSAFRNMPINFKTSFLRKRMKKGLNLPSSTLKPRLDNSGVYPDIIYSKDSIYSKQKNISVFDRTITN